MNKKILFLNIFSLIILFLNGCTFSKQEKIIIIPNNKVKENFNINDSYINNQIRKSIDLVYKKNFIKREIATNEMELGKKTLNYYSYRIIKYEKIKKDDIDIFLNSSIRLKKRKNDNFDDDNNFIRALKIRELLTKNLKTKKETILNRNNKIKKKFLIKKKITVVSFNNNIKRINLNNGIYYLIKINKINGTINFYEVGKKIKKNLITQNDYFYNYLIYFNKKKILIFDKNLKKINEIKFDKNFKNNENLLKLTNDNYIVYK